MEFLAGMSSLSTKRRRIRSDIEKYMTQIDEESETCIGENETYDCQESVDSIEIYLAAHTSTHFVTSEIQDDCSSNLSDHTICEPELFSSSPTCDSNNDFFADNIEQLPISSDSEAMSSEDEYEAPSYLQNMLAGWAAQYIISEVALGSLLKILRKWFVNLPKDPRTLKQKNKQVVIPVKQLAGGCYCHIGLEKSICNQLSHDGVVEGGSRTVCLQINIDGLPLYKSSSAQFWPILGLIQNYSDFGTKTKSDPFVIGIYHGNSKPSDVNEYLSDFVKEARDLQMNGFLYCGFLHHFKISSVVCDMPARSWIKCVTGHTGYGGCDKCTQRGTFFKCVTFPDCNAPLRTDKSFIEMTDKKHHRGKSPFVELSLGMVSTFPIDYMHLVCLGVMRKLVSLWLAGPLKTRIGRYDVATINERLICLKKYIPVEFQRKPRPLSEYERWKATEFRMLLLYTGYAVLCEVLPKEVYHNYLLFSVAVHILVNPCLCTQYNEFSHKLLVLFVEHFGQLYGSDRISYNVHGLVHLSTEAKQFGVLDNVAAFPFENFLGKLKKLLRKPNFPLQQVVSYLQLPKFQYNSPSSGGVKRLHTEGPITSDISIVEQYRELHLDTFCIKLSHADCHVQLRNGDIVVVKNIITRENGYVEILYKKFNVAEDIFTYPMASSDIGVFRLATVGGRMHHCSVSSIVRKYVVLPFKDVFVGVPLIHTWRM